jgi:hypothetical protein
MEEGRYDQQDSSVTRYLKQVAVRQKDEAILSAPVSRVRCRKLVFAFHSLDVELGRTSYSSAGQNADSMCRWVGNEEMGVHKQGHTARIQEVMRAPGRRRLAPECLLRVHSVPTDDKTKGLPVPHGDCALASASKSPLLISLNGDHLTPGRVGLG